MEVKDSGQAWPAAGWTVFQDLNKRSNQVVAKGPGGQIRGLSYKISSEKIYHRQRQLYKHAIQIRGWEYAVYCEGLERPILSFDLADRYDLRVPAVRLVTQVKILGHPVPTDFRSVRNLLAAARACMCLVDSGHILDAENILRIYDVFPSPQKTGSAASLRPADGPVYRRPEKWLEKWLDDPVKKSQ